MRSTQSITSPDREAPSGKSLLNGLLLGATFGAVSDALSFVGSRWYLSLVRPEWAPQLGILALVQILVFAFVGAAWGYLKVAPAFLGSKRVVLTWFWVTLALCLLWSAAFWGFKSVGWGYAVIMCAWCAAVALLWTGSKLSRTAFFLLVPLWVWVTFASSLNFAILSFNTLRQVSASMDADPRNANSPADPPIIVKKK